MKDQSHRRSLIRVSAAIILCLGAVGWQAGAAGIHFYNPGKDKSARDAQAGYTNNPPIKVINLETARLEDRVRRLNELTRNQHAVLRDRALLTLLGSTSPFGTEFFEQRVLADLKTVRGSLPLTSTFAGFRSGLQRLAMYAARFELLTAGATLPVAPLTPLPERDELEKLLKKAPEATRAAAADEAAHFITARQQIDTEIRQVATPPAGEETKLREALDLWRKAIEGRIREEKAATELTGRVKQAEKDLEAKLKEWNGKDPGKVSMAFSNLYVSVHGMNLGLVTNLLSREQETLHGIALLQSAIESFASGKPPAKSAITNAGIASGLAVLSSSSNLAVSAQALFRELARPPVARMQMELTFLRLELAEIRARIAIDDRRIQAAEDRFLGYYRQASLLRVIQQIWNNSLDQASRDLLNQRSLRYLLDDPASLLGSTLSKGVPLREIVYRMLLDYLTSIRVAQAEVELAENRITTAAFDEALVVNRSAVALWDGLIAEPINQVTAYHAGGIKPEELADLLVKALGFGAVAWRSN